ncbi:IS66 family insertion sequence element accessory protein TnpB [Ensifer canadensis]|uniref:IS66 family insertion sequence element accessory protein TnpB n=1 Tax=Ensifer canadensis TaxID=555315 RepID=UPI0035E3C38A
MRLCGAPHNRKGINGLAALVSTTLGANPYSGDVYIFRSKRNDRLKMVAWDGSGMVLVTNDLHSYCISLSHSVEGFGLAGILLTRGDAIDELVPSTALLLR